MQISVCWAQFLDTLKVCSVQLRPRGQLDICHPEARYADLPARWVFLQMSKISLTNIHCSEWWWNGVFMLEFSYEKVEENQRPTLSFCIPNSEVSPQRNFNIFQLKLNLKRLKHVKFNSIMYAKKSSFSQKKNVTADGTQNFLQERLKNTRRLRILANMKDLFLQTHHFRYTYSFKRLMYV